ncbi:MAG: M64 family metallopeptidase [Candidatus Nanoarchaeia archaeon]
MAISLSFKQFVIIVIAIIVIILGTVLTNKITNLSRSTVNEVPIPFQQPPLVTIEPSSSQEGTLFYITANPRETLEVQEYSLDIQTKGYSTEVTLYDDGNNFDLTSGDGIYAGFFDSSGKPLGKYNITKNDETLTTFTIHKPGCQIIEGNPKRTNINFVILPSGYDDYDEFKVDAKQILTGRNSLISIEPFKSNKDKFSFSVVNTSKDLECQIGCSNVPNAICCNHKIVSEEASQCDHDSILVLVNSKEHCGSSTNYAKVCSRNKFSDLILVHELGHSFAGLADEYVYEEQYPGLDIGDVTAINCAPAGCEKWSETEGGCYQGCTYSDLYRPEKTESIMYTFYPGFNKVSERYIEKLIVNYINSKNELGELSPKQQSYFINLEYNNGSIGIKNVFLKPIETSLDLKPSEYSAEIENVNDETIFETKILLPNTIYPIWNETDSTITLDNFEFSIITPYFSDAESLEILKNNKTVAETSLVIFSNTCGNSICEESENHLSCEEDCKIDQDGFCQESICDPDCSSQKHCQRNKYFLYGIIIVSIFILITIIISLLRKK